jgi:hypothetical protein
MEVSPETPAGKATGSGMERAISPSVFGTMFAPGISLYNRVAIAAIKSGVTSFIRRPCFRD